MNKATIDGEELELVLPGGDVWYQAYFKPDRSVRSVLASRPPVGSPGGRGTTDSNSRGYQELSPAPANSTETRPSDETRRGTE